MEVPKSQKLNLFFAGGAKVKEEPEKEDLSDDQENSDIDVDHHETSTEVSKPTTENYGNMGCPVSNF